MICLCDPAHFSCLLPLAIVTCDPITAALDIGGKLIDRLWPDPAERDRAKLELLRMQ